MGKTRPSKSSKSGSKSNKAPKSKALNTETPEILHAQAATSLQTGDPESALPKALKALSLTPESDQSRLPVLNLLGEIYLELGDQAKGYEAYHEAVEIDRSVSSDSSIPGTGPEKYFCLAQLSEEGGKASLAWFEEGIQILERNVQELESKKGKDAQIELKDCRKQLSGALCGIIELWMTDLS
jgi:tetratricopeptide (TPR) repeat protein